MKKKKEDTVLIPPLWNEGMGPLFDPLGSYTGKPENVDELPVQDADDL